MLHRYDYIQVGSNQSAKTVLPLILDFLPTIRSVLDIDCGADAWLYEYAAQGIDDYLGVDDRYVQTESLPIPRDHFLASDLTRTFNLKRRFDLVQCLEVTEHLPAKYSTVLIDNISRHSDVESLPCGD